LNKNLVNAEIMGGISDKITIRANLQGAIYPVGLVALV
jgi:hypothetical protein